jgi:hypothetical protein
MIGRTEYRLSPWLARGIVLMTLVVIVGVALVFWNTLSPAQPADTAPAAVSGAMTQTNEGGQVTIKATWQGPSAGPIFDVVLDTHAVDLDGYDLTQLATLRIARNYELSPENWSISFVPVGFAAHISCRSMASVAYAGKKTPACRKMPPVLAYSEWR